jgi:hypothetical protein
MSQEKVIKKLKRIPYAFDSFKPNLLASSSLSRLIGSRNDAILFSKDRQ